MSLELKTSAELAHRNTDAKGKLLPHPVTTLTIKGELLPAIEIQHHILAALLNEEDPPKVNVEFTNVNDVLSFVVTFEHDDDVVAAGKAAHDLAVEARNHVPPLTVAQLVEKKKAAAEKLAKQQKETEAASAAAKK